jgi:iron complex outermembrane receptor protein
VQNRQNYAQDLQISSRGFGGRVDLRRARRAPHRRRHSRRRCPTARGRRRSFDLSTAERIEVLRGPFASLYGNASGGVVQVFTADGPPEPTVDAHVLRRQLRTWKIGAQLGGTSGAHQLHRRRFALRDGRLSRPQRRAPRPVEREAQDTLGAGQLTLS